MLTEPMFLVFCFCFCFLLFGFFYNDLWERFIFLSIRRKQFNFLNNSAGEVILEYKKMGGVLVSERRCLQSLQCSLTPFLLKASIKQLEGLCHRDPSTRRLDPNITHPLSLHPSLHPAEPVSCPRTGASHSRGKEILCKNTGSQRRQDSGQAWQGVCVNSSEQADFAQQG